MSSNNQIKTVIDSLTHVQNNPNYKNNGFTAVIHDNGTIILKAVSENDYHRHSLSKEDSDMIIRLIKMSANEKIVK